MLLRYEQNTKVHPLVLSYQTGSQELKIEVELQQIGEQSLENQYNSTLRLESNKWKLFFKKKDHGKKQCILRRRMKRKRRGYCIFFPSVCYCGAALMESILRARERCIKCCGGGLARPLIAGIRNATRNVVISKIVSPFFIVYWRPFLPLQPKNGREINGNSLETFILIKVFASTIPGLESLMMVAVNTINADTTL